MNYLLRKADTFLKDWIKNPDRYPLIIKGMHDKSAKQKPYGNLQKRITKI